MIGKTMECRNKEIKELLPSYLADELDSLPANRVQEHLASCDDCRNELSLLSIMAEEPVPDPGRDFWDSLPAAIERAVKQQKTKQKMFDIGRLRELLVLPRWAWAAAAAAFTVALSWTLLFPVNRAVDWPSFSGDEYLSDGSSGQEVAIARTVAELSRDELENVDNWAAKELSAIAGQAGPAMTPLESEPADELADLDSREMEDLSSKLDELYEEG